MSTTVGTISVHLTSDPEAISVTRSGHFSWLQLGPVILHTDGSSPEALRAMAAALLDLAQNMERPVQLERVS